MMINAWGLLFSVHVRPLGSSHAAGGVVTRTLTYPRRGLHGEVVHLIGLQIVSGELKPGDPLPRRTSSSPISLSAAPCLREAVRVLAAKGSSRPGRRPGRVFGARTEWNILDPDVLSWRAEASNDRRLYEETTEVRLAIEPLAARLAATERLRGRDRRDRRGVRGHGDRRRRPGRIPRCRPSLPRSDPRRVPQRAARSPRRRPPRRCSARPSSSRRRRGAHAGGRSPCTRRSSTASRPGTRTRAEAAAQHADRRHGGGHRRIARRDAAALEARRTLELERLKARRYGDVEPSRCGVDDGRRRNRVSREAVPVDGTSRDAPRSSASSTASAASMLPTIPRDSRSASRPLIGSSATSTPSAAEAAVSSSVTIVSPAW